MPAHLGEGLVEAVLLGEADGGTEAFVQVARGTAEPDAPEGVLGQFDGGGIIVVEDGGQGEIGRHGADVGEAPGGGTDDGQIGTGEQGDQGGLGPVGLAEEIGKAGGVLGYHEGLEALDEWPTLNGQGSRGPGPEQEADVTPVESRGELTVKHLPCKREHLAPWRSSPHSVQSTHPHEPPIYAMVLVV